MKAVVLTVGTEILFGQIVNSNSQYLSKELQDLGIDVMYHHSVGDNPKRLKELLDMSYRDCDFIITTGGLGPTQDDLTKEVIGEYFQEEMIEDPKTLEWLQSHFKKAGYVWNENNRKQAFFPKNARILPNSVGSAPGFYFEKNGKAIAALPGPPKEMTAMFEKELKPILAKEKQDTIYYRILRTFGIGESTLETMLMKFIDGQTDPTIATYAKSGECSLRITSKRKSYKEAKEAVDRMAIMVTNILGESVYSFHNEELAEVVGKLLIEKNISFSCAESCTGGMLASALTEIPGISKVFNRGLVTYSWKAKEEELGVKRHTLKEFHAESPEVAMEMVSGLKKRTKSDLCVSITGVAGPDDLDEERPAGLAYIGLSYQDITKVITLKHRNVSRQRNRAYMTLKTLYEIYLLIK